MTVDMSEFCLTVLATATTVITVVFTLCVTYWLSVDGDVHAD